MYKVENYVCDHTMHKVKNCICNYAICNVDDTTGSKTIVPDLIFNLRTNADIVCEIMNLDEKHKVYKSGSKTVNIEKVETFDNRKRL